MAARGVVYIHSCPTAVCPHVEWALGRALEHPVSLSWSQQPADPTTQRAEYPWAGPVGSAGSIATALKAWSMLRFEITEEPSPGVDGERYAHVPGRGVHRSTMSASGDVLIREGRLRHLLAVARDGEELTEGLEALLGAAWDAELEPYRLAGAGAELRYLPPPPKAL